MNATLKLCGFALGASVLLSSCGGKIEGTNFERLPFLNPGSATGIIQVSPTQNAQEVSAQAEIQIKFSGPVDTSKVEPFMLRVENDVGQIYSTEAQFNSSQDQVTIVRKINGHKIPWDMSTKLTVFAQYLEDQGALAIWPYSWSFWTKGLNETTGQFSVKENGINPSSTIINPSTWIELDFNEPVYPNFATQNPNFWNAAIEIYVVNTLDANGVPVINVPALPTPNFDLVCAAPNNCHQLRLKPAGGWPMPHFSLNVVVIRVLQNLQLRGAYSNESLGDDITIVKVLNPF